MMTALAQLNIWSKVQFSKDVGMLEVKLNKLWTNLKGEEEKYERFTTAWVDIGFQGKDPATDFRGVGVLGLEQLLFLTSKGSPYRETALKMYKDSTITDTWYFFCVAGINISQKILLAFLEDSDLQTIVAEHYQVLEHHAKNRHKQVNSDEHRQVFDFA